LWLEVVNKGPAHELAIWTVWLVPHEGPLDDLRRLADGDWSNAFSKDFEPEPWPTGETRTITVPVWSRSMTANRTYGLQLRVHVGHNARPPLVGRILDRTAYRGIYYDYLRIQSAGTVNGFWLGLATLLATILVPILIAML
jgi:hypothetical protein